MPRLSQGEGREKTLPGEAGPPFQAGEEQGSMKGPARLSCGEPPPELNWGLKQVSDPNAARPPGITQGTLDGSGKPGAGPACLAGPCVTCCRTKGDTARRSTLSELAMARTPPSFRADTMKMKAKASTQSRPFAMPSHQKAAELLEHSRHVGRKLFSVPRIPPSFGAGEREAQSQSPSRSGLFQPESFEGLSSAPQREGRAFTRTMP